MSQVFERYGDYYDLLYQDKPYEAEARYIDKLIHRFAASPGKKLLELGCGSGRHALHLADLGYQVLGVELSETMLHLAEANLKKASLTSPSVAFAEGDMRSFRCNDRFDVVLSLFHVMSYQACEEDLRKSLQTAYEHLAPKGLLIFDFWYGPAVLADPPQMRVKRVANENLAITRITEPKHDVNARTVDVNFDVFIKTKPSGIIEELFETHKMRYFFPEELDMALTNVGFERKTLTAWLSDAPPDKTSFGACIVAQKRN